MNAEADLYELLQVSPKAEPEVIEAAYRRLARKYHPDAGADEADPARMTGLNRAYETLRDPSRRAAYDRQRSVRAATPQPPAPPRAARRAAAAAVAAVAAEAPQDVAVAPAVDVRRIAIACRECRSTASRHGAPIGWPRGDHFREGSTLRCVECGRHWRYSRTLDHSAVLDPKRQYYSVRAGKVVWRRRSLFGTGTLAALLALAALAVVASVLLLPDLTAAIFSELTRLGAEPVGRARQALAELQGRLWQLP